jgi:hypothetical protein
VLKRPELADLLARLASPNEAERESAVARLTLLGALALPKLAALARNDSTPDHARAGALRVLAATGGSAAIEAAAAALLSKAPAVVDAACDLLGRWAREPGSDGAKALDELAGLALSSDAPADSRLSAIAALEGQPDELMRPIYDALARDPSSRIVSRAARAQVGVAWSLDALIDRGLPDDPALVAVAVRDEGAETPVTDLRRAIDLVRAREAAVADDERPVWRAIRGSLHEALAVRGSRIAVYDLREAFEEADAPLPIGFLTAAAAVGDPATLEGIAAAWESAERDRWYRDHLVDVFGAIVRREALTREHATLKRILTRRPSTSALVALAPKRPRRRGSSQ